METVSVITPTRNRERFLHNLESLVRHQTYPSLEWIIHDDSPAPSAHFASLADPRVKYLHSTAPLSIGEKRNRMVQIAEGGIIAHFDDDDYYSADYLATMVGRMDEGYDFVKLSAWFLYSGLYRALGYWDCRETQGLHHVWSNRPQSIACFDARDARNLKQNCLGFGFSYVYKKAVWAAVPFPDVNWNEDEPFASRANERFKLRHFPDASGLCLHILHKTNTSRCFPQYCLPGFLIDRLFGPACYPAVQASWD
jgi:glycosyltransferase involved in cell wall biosynthesis